MCERLQSNINLFILQGFLGIGFILQGLCNSKQCWVIYNNIKLKKLARFSNK